MGTDCDKSEVVHLDIWKSGVLFKILAIYSLLVILLIFPMLSTVKMLLLLKTLMATSPIWGYSDSNEFKGRIQHFRSSPKSNLYITSKSTHLSAFQWQRLYPGSIDSHC
ncbi:hypothetical protein NPIL_232821 [Nephila pilipes]|uniref:Uncharacterized protein n=1 Tax=Nephila pilipes TaxID=299642 RepID=A0A8X6Q3K5_NEPPI|nr:hypothetical protein NPIL_232821 [Nephila pilipes]